MRKDVKLGLVFSFVIVVGAGWYYASTDRAEELLTLADSGSAREQRPEQTTHQPPALLADADKQTPARRDSAGERATGKRRPARRATKAPTRTPTAGAKDRSSDALPPTVGGKPKPAQGAKSDKPVTDKPTTPARTGKSDKPLRDQPASKASDRDQPAAGAQNAVAELWDYDKGAADSAKRRPDDSAKSDAARRGAAAQREHKNRSTPAAKTHAQPDSPSGRKAGASKTREPYRTHVVRRGDSYARLAEQYYGSQRHTQFLMSANPKHADPRSLRVGMELKIPPLIDQPKPTPAAERSRSALGTGDGQAYVVREGDSFYRIAVRELGSGSRWPELFELNKSKVNGKPEALRPGQVLVLPSDKPATTGKKRT